MKRFLHAAATLSALAISFALASCATEPKAKEEKSDKKQNVPYVEQMKSKSAQEIVDDMRIGWNLGNTLDAWIDGQGGVESETSWQQPKTTKEMFTGLKKAGFNAVRIPITWHNHFIDDKLTVDPAWLARSKEVVDMAIGEGLYVIINIHHDTAPAEDFADGRGYYPTENAKEKSLRFVTRVWEQISATFNNEYDEHLVFELLNEPRLVGHEREWWYDPNHPDCAASQKVVNELEEACINVIRKSGGANAQRFIMLPGYVAQPWAAMADTFTLPADSSEGRLIISVHMYDPWSFAGDNPGELVFTDSAKAEQKNTFEALNRHFVKKGVPVIIGECGATNKNNLEAREDWYRYYFETSKKNGLTAFIWDNGSYEVGEDGNFSEHFGFYNRTSQTFYFPTLLQAALDGVTAGEKAE